MEKFAPRILYGYNIRRSRRSEPEVALLPQLCRRNAISIDVGANMGLYSYYMLPHSFQVIAFEPLPQMQKRLEAYFGGDIVLHKVALSDQEGTVEIRMPTVSLGMATIDAHNTLSLAIDVPTMSIAVQTRRLDSYELNNVGFMKIDVEGHEEGVLRGGIETIRRNRPTLLVEIEERHHAGSIGRVHAFLKELGYEGFFFFDGAMNPMAAFDAARDQRLEHVGVGGKTGRYINNFIFKPA